MRHAENTGREFAKKLLFLLLGLALFAAPLSHKFYLFSSQQSIRRGGSFKPTAYSIHPNMGVADNHECRLLSLDKRYDHKQTYDLLFPFLVPITWPKPGKTERYVPTDLAVVRGVPSSYLRGPPDARFPCI